MTVNVFSTALVVLLISVPLQAGEVSTAFPSSKDAKGSIVLPDRATHRWSLGAGAIFRNIGDVNFRTGISPNNIPNLFGGNTFTEPPGIGPLGATANRTYDDGFVNNGAGTPGTGLTTFWGHNNASQVQGGNMVYSRAGGERREVTRRDIAAGTSWSDDAGWEAGPFLELTYTLDIAPNLSAGIAINFSSVKIGGSQGGLNTLSQFQQLDVYAVTAVDTYSLGGIVPPNAPFVGSFAGPGPLINNIPDSRALPENLASTTTAQFVDSVRDDLALDLHTLGIGSNVNWMPGPQLLLAAQFGVALNLADWKGQRDELITQSNNGGPAGVFSRRTARIDARDIVAGVYLQGNLAWILNDRWAIQGFARYDWNQELKGMIGPSSFTVDLSGWSLGAGARFSF